MANHPADAAGLSYEPTRLYKIRHSLAHIMAQAVLEMFPEAKIGIGPPTEEGFYYDFDLPRSLTTDDLQVIEERMKEIVRAKHDFVRREISAAEARDLFMDQPYKLELIEGLAAGESDEYGAPTGQAPAISIYRHDTFEDLCRGPHVASTAEINLGAFKLLRVSGAYWRGSEKNPMLQRIYGTAFETPEQLDEYLRQIEEAKVRDHRTLGRELDLFSFSQAVGPGLVLWHPRGGRLRETIEEYWSKRHREGGYQRVYTPHIGRSTLWETSGHLKWYKEGMYAPLTIEEEQYYVKPMNCPFHVEIFKSERRSYHDLPMRLAEMGTVYRYERSGVLHGLLRVRGFTQDDAHIFCTLEQMSAEVVGALQFSLSVLQDFGLEDFLLELSLPDPNDPEHYAGSAANWELAQQTLVQAIETTGLTYKPVVGEAVFYGPKIDIKMRDSLHRLWQLSTVQFDFWLPKVFELEYIGPDGVRHQPYMVHRALFGSIERFIAMLIEHYKGAFPAWLAPVQVVLVPVAGQFVEYAHQVAATLSPVPLRVKVDDSNDRMGNKIRKAQQLVKPPYTLVVGERERSTGQVSVRLRSGEDQGTIPVAEFIEYCRKAIDSKAYE